MGNYCPCCGLELEEPAWDNDINPSYEICPCCGIQFGYTDFCGGDVVERKNFYKKQRELWKNSNYSWHSESDEKPQDWNPLEQLKNIE